jgi:hypothetical protein
MRAMRPTAAEVLQSVIETYEQYIQPEVQEPFAKSLSLTLPNLMRNVLFRMEREGPALFEEARDLREVVVVVADYADASRLPQLAAAVREVCAREWRKPGEYLSVATLTDEVLALRGALDRAIADLQAVEQQRADDAAYADLRARIRGALERMLEREASWTYPAFTGPRR